MDVKNLMEVIAALKLAVVSIKGISKDGVGVDDLPKALELLKKYDLFLAAVKDIDMIDEEIKDVDSAEAILVVTALMAAIKEIKEA